LRSTRLCEGPRTEGLVKAKHAVSDFVNLSPKGWITTNGNMLCNAFGEELECQ
jgi:hypothetical protein